MALSVASFPSSHLRSSSFPSLLLYSLNLLLFTLSSASLAPILLLHSPPTSFGWALLVVSTATLFSSLLAFFAHAAHFCFIAYASVASSAIVGQSLAVLTLLLQPEPSLQLLSPETNLRNTEILEKIEAGILVGMLAVQAAAMVSACAVQRWWEREHREVEMEKKVAARRRSRRVATEQDVALANAVAVTDAEKRDIEDRIRSKWAKIEFDA